MVNYTVLKIQHTEPLLITKLARGAEETWILWYKSLRSTDKFSIFFVCFFKLLVMVQGIMIS